MTNVKTLCKVNTLIDTADPRYSHKALHDNILREHNKPGPRFLSTGAMQYAASARLKIDADGCATKRSARTAQNIEEEFQLLEDYIWPMVKSTEGAFSTRALFILVVLVYCIVQMSYLISYSSMPEWNHLTVDNHYHHNWARDIADGNVVGDTTYFRAPFYVWCLAAFYALFLPTIWIARIFGLLVGLGIVSLTYRLARQLLPGTYAVVAACIAALCPALIYFNAELLLDSLFTLLVLWSVDRFVVFERDSSRANAVCLGIALGVAALTRPTILPMIPILFIWNWCTDSCSTRRWILVLVACALVILPITARHVILTHDSVLIASQGGVNFFIGNNSESDGVSAVMPEPLGWNWQLSQVEQIAEQSTGRTMTPGEISSYWSSQAWEWIRNNPGDAIILYVRKLSFAFSDREISNNRDLSSFFRAVPILGLNPFSFGVLFVFGLIGIAMSRDKHVRFLGLFVLGFLLLTCLFFYTSRFRLPAIPILIILATLGLKSTLDAMRSNRRALLPIVILVTCGIAVSFVPWAELQRGSFSQSEITRGLYELSEKQYSRARDTFVNIVEADSSYPEANLNLGAAYVRLGKPDSALMAFVREAQYHPLRHRAYINIASVLLLTERLGEAMSAAQRAVNLAPWDPQSWIVALRIRYASDSVNPESIISLADSAAIATHNNVLVLTEAGAVLGTLGRFQEARQFLKNAVDAPPPPVETNDQLFGPMSESPRDAWEQSKAGAWFQLGFIAGIEGRFGDAMACSRTAITLDSLNERAWVNLIAAYRSTDQNSIADSLARSFSALFPQSQFLDRIQ